MNSSKVLVVEDDARVVVFVVDQLEYLGYHVTVARDGVEALEKVKEACPDLIVLDVMMPRMDGYEVCRQLKTSPTTKRIPILMLTAKGQLQDRVKGFDIGADGYLPKPFDKDEFEAMVKALLKRSITPPFDIVQNDCIFSISCEPKHQMNIRANGAFTLSASTQNPLILDADVSARQAENVPLLDWRFNSKQWGKQLYQQFFVKHPEVLGNYNQALGTVIDEERLRLRFESTRDFLRVSIEFLFEDVQDGGDYIVLKHPVARAIRGVQVKKASLSPVYFNDLWSKAEELRILLIASNTLPSIPGVDEEINYLSEKLKALFEDRRISTQVKVIPTEQATPETVKNELAKCRYHIIHYAGHGAYDKQSPEKSSLFFWEKPNCQGEVERMPVSELEMLLRGSELRFFYLSCCLGAATGEPTKLLDDDFLGIADGIIHVGVPSVLGFRRPVSDSGAKTMALAFYKSLAKQGQIDTALLDARCAVAAQNRDDITWLSPVLIMQA